MTGGTLPAKTWHDIMAYAHQGIAIKPIRGLASPATLAARGRRSAQDGGARRAGASRGALARRAGGARQIELKMKLDDAEAPRRADRRAGAPRRQARRSALTDFA